MVTVYVVSFRPFSEMKCRRIIGVFASSSEAERVLGSLPICLEPLLERTTFIPFKPNKDFGGPIKCD